MSQLVAFNNDPKLKKMLCEEIAAHKAADKIIQGTYGNERGFCAVGCAIHSLNIHLNKKWERSDHSVFEKELGIPEQIARLEDSIFEGLTAEEAKDFPLEFMEAIPVGADLSRVIAAFSVWLLTDPSQGVIRFARDENKAIIQQISDLHHQEAEGKTVNEEQWSAARSAAESAAESAARSAEYAAESAARSAARSAAWSAAWSAARSAAWSAESAAWSAESAAEYAARSAAEYAAESAARSAARSAAWSAESAAWSAESAAEYAARSAQAKKLIELLRDAPIAK